MKARLRTGIGFDIHPLEPERPLILGGVDIAFEKGLSGWSDGDVLCHAIIDALLGAATLGDIGQHFPPGQERYHNISSLVLLEETRDLLEADGWQIVNIDATVIAAKPLLSPFITPMRQQLAKALGKPLDCISVKASTTNGLGHISRGEGIACQAIAMLEYTTGEDGEDDTESR